MSKQEELVELARAAYDAMARGDIPWMQEHTHPDVVFQQGGRFPTAGTFYGRDAMFGHFVEFMTMVEGKFSIDVHDILASDQRAAAYITVEIGWQGKQFSFDEVHLWTIADGLVVDMRALPFDPYALDDFLAGAAAPSSTPS